MNNYMKRIVRYALVHGVCMSLSMTAISYWISDHRLSNALLTGVTCGILTGLVNGLLYYKFSAPKYVLDAVSFDIRSDEQIVFQAPANYTGGTAPVSGKLFLTDKRLVFRNHKHEKTTLHLSIDLPDIAAVHSFKTLMLLENGLLVQTAADPTHRFIVGQSRQWIGLLDKQKTTSLDPSMPYFE